LEQLQNTNAPVTKPFDYSFQLLQIHHLGYPHDVSKLRIQIRPENVLQLRDKLLIVGYYNIDSVKIYAVFDPLHIASLNFKSTTSLNISQEDLNLCYKYGPILKKDKLESAILILKKSNLEDFLTYFHSNSEDHNIFQWRKVIISFFKNILTKKLNYNFQKFNNYKATAENYNHLKDKYNVKFIRIEDQGFKIGYQPETSLIVENSLAEYLTYSHHYLMEINSQNFGNIFLDELKIILKQFPNLFFQVYYDRIEINYNYDKYFTIISEFLSNRSLKCATSKEINHHITFLYPTIKLDFKQTKTSRFKERIIAGKSEDHDSYYFDSNDETINDIVNYAKSYSEFLTDQFNYCNNIYDLYLKVHNIDQQADCYKFWSAFKRSVRSASFEYNLGNFSTGNIPDFRKDKIINYINIFFNNKDSKYIIFKKDDLTRFKLYDHFIIRFMISHLPYFEDKYTINFEIDILYVNNNKVSGFCILGSDSSIGLFPLVAPEVFLNRSEKYFFCYNSNYYYITENKGTINLQVI